MLRYKAKIEDLEATLAQKGQVGIWLLVLLQMQTIQSDFPLDHPVPIQDTAWLSTVIFSNCVRMLSSLFLSLVFCWPEREPSYKSE